MTEYDPKEFEKKKPVPLSVKFIKIILSFMKGVISIMVFAVIVLGLFYLLKILILKLFY